MFTVYCIAATCIVVTLFLSLAMRADMQDARANGHNVLTTRQIITHAIMGDFDSLCDRMSDNWEYGTELVNERRTISNRVAIQRAWITLKILEFRANAIARADGF